MRRRDALAHGKCAARGEGRNRKCDAGPDACVGPIETAMRDRCARPRDDCRGLWLVYIEVGLRIGQCRPRPEPAERSGDGDRNGQPLHRGG
jgi:hypothetical protein